MIGFAYVLALLITIAVLMMAIAIRKAQLRALRRRRVRDGATAIGDGETVTVRGEVRRIGELIAPLSGKPCVLYETHATYAPWDGKERTVHETVVAAELDAFELDTEHGTIRVEGEAFELVDFRPVPIIPRKLEREIAFLTKQGRSGNEAAQTRFEEVRVEPGTRIAVHGTAAVDGKVIRIVAADRPLTIEIT